METVTEFLFLSSKITTNGDCSPGIKRCLLLWRKKKKIYDQQRQHVKKQRHYFTNKCPYSQSDSFFSSHVWMWVLDYKEDWAPGYWCFWSMVLEKTLESPLDCKGIQPVNTRGNQSWIFIGRWCWSCNTLAAWCEELIHWKRPWC